MPVRSALALVVASALLGGCLDRLDIADDGATALPETGATWAEEVFFTSSMGLAAAPEAEAAGVRAGNFFRAWAAGDEYVTWEGAPFAVDAVVENMTVHLAFRVTGPVVESARFPDIMVYGASGGAFMAFASTAEYSVLQPGEVYELDLALATPVGGLVVPAGERVAFKVVPVMHQNDAGDIEVLVGGDAPSRANWTATRIAPFAADGSESDGRHDGESTGSAYAGDAAPESTRWRQVVALPADTQRLLVWMNTTDAQGIPDIDLAIVGPDGTEIASSGTPTPREMLRLGAPNLQGAGDYTVVVTSYGSAHASFVVEWRAA